MRERVKEFGIKWIEFYKKIKWNHLQTSGVTYRWLLSFKVWIQYKKRFQVDPGSLSQIWSVFGCVLQLDLNNHLMRATVRVLTTPAPHHPGWNTVGPALAGGAGCCRVFRRARFSPLLLQQVRQCPGDQRQSQCVNVLVDAGSSKTLVENQAFLCLSPLCGTYRQDFQQYVQVWTRGLVGLGCRRENGATDERRHTILSGLLRQLQSFHKCSHKTRYHGLTETGETSPFWTTCPKLKLTTKMSPTSAF